MLLRKYFLLLIAALPCALSAQTKLYTEQYRPQFHFSPALNWCNDPNGLVYNNGTYHLFYQHNPYGNEWGHMTWGHATSTDLVHWKHLSIAIPEENGVMIFSGSCVVDHNNTSGFGKNGKAPMVAIYTGHIENVNQSQHIAYSTDDGVTWVKYNGNPVLDLHKKDFRDPKVFWYEPQKYWVMALMFPVEHLVQFYASKNLKEWKHLSDFGPVGDTSGVWECPDLTQVPVQGRPSQKKWLLQTSQNASMQYFVGEFNGTTFTNENSGTVINRPDYGPDYYAAITYNQLPANIAPTAIGWVNNWNYANTIPTTPWKSAMSLPRNLSVKQVDHQWVLVQKPVPALSALREKKISFPAEKINSAKILGAKTLQFEMELKIVPTASAVCGVRAAVAGDHYLEIGYDAARQVLYVDRSNAGNNTFNNNFTKAARFEKAVPLHNHTLQLHLYIDNSIAEVYANDGEVVFTTQFFPDKNNTGIALFSNGGASTFSHINLWSLKSAW